MAYIGPPAPNRFVAPKAASVFSGDGSTTAFTLDHAVGSDEDILVSVDGVIQEPSVAYAVSSGTTLTFTAAPSSNSGNNIFVYYLFRTVGTVSHPSNNALQATNGTLTGTLDVTGDATFDTSTLKVDSTNNRVGIGTTSPSSTLTVDGATAFSTLELASTSGSATSAFMGVTTSSDLAVKVNGSERMRIDADGHVTMQSQPAFLVTKTTARDNKPSSGDETISFETEVFDQNSDISSNTFTAPVTGKYQFNATIRLDEVDTASAYVRIKINTSNRVYVSIIDPNFSADLTYITLNLSVLADMDASDTAIVEVGQSGGSAQMDLPGNAQYQQFSGYLVA